MLNIEVNNTPYKAFHDWSEMPLSLAVSIHSLISEQMPEKLKLFYALISAPDDQAVKEEAIKEWYEKLEDEERIKQLPAFYGKAMTLLTTIPEDIIAKINPADRDVFYKTFCEKFVYGILYWPNNLELKHIKSFVLNKEEYFLPETKNIMGTERPFYSRTAIEFTEVADLEIFAKQMTGGKYEVAANIISILCRKKIPVDPKTLPTIKADQKTLDTIKASKKLVLEPYVEEVSLERAEKFLSLTMDIVFEVFFCLSTHIIISNQLMTISLLKEVANVTQDLKPRV